VGGDVWWRVFGDVLELLCEAFVGGASSHGCDLWDVGCGVPVADLCWLGVLVED
jgi:hypothetical protein